MPQSAEPTALRLEPGRESLRLLVLAFIRDYVRTLQGSPSQGEIARALRVDPRTVRKALKSLAREGLILLSPGHRGISLPGVREEAVRQLRGLGWVVDEDLHRVAPPPPPDYAPNRPLRPPPFFDYISEPGALPGGTGSSDGDNGGADAPGN